MEKLKYVLNIFSDLENEISKDNISQVIWQINNIAFSFLYKDELGLFIQNNQKALANFKTGNRHPAAADTILHFLESNFSEHLNPSLAISDISRHKLADTFGEKLGPVQTIINGLPAGLLEISYPLLSLNQSSSITVHQYQYFKTFYPYLITLALKDENITDENHWLSLLLRANFNHFPFIEYLISKIIRETSEEDYLEGRQEILFGHQKTYNQLIEYKGMNYDSNLLSAKEQILLWIAEELRHGRKRIQANPTNQTEIQFNKTAKFHTNMSVVQLSCLVKGLIDADIFIFKHEKDVFRAVAENFVTPYTKNISPESLYNKQFTMEAGTKESVRKMLQKAINSLDRNQEGFN